MTRNYAAMQRVLIISFICNLLATAVKLGAGIATGALSLIADGLDTLFDSLANVIGLWATRVGQQPPDDDHPYGHRKFETVAALFIASLLFVVAWELGSSAVSRLLEPSEPVINRWSIGALIVGGLIQGSTGWWEIRRGRALHSEILIADGRHALTSLFVSFGVLIGLGMVALGFWWADPVAALLVAGLIVKIGVDTVRENVPALVDEAMVSADRIGRIVAHVPGVESYHRIRSRGTADSVAIDLHVRVAPHLSMQAGNAIGDEVRRRLYDLPHVGDVTVHIEAQRGPESAGDLYATVQRCADELGVTIHEFWVHDFDGTHSVHLHVGVNPTLTLAEAHDLVDALEHMVHERQAQVTSVQTHIELANTDVLPSSPVSGRLQLQVEDAIIEAADAVFDLQEPHDITVRQVEGQLFIALEAFVAGDMYMSVAHDHSHALEQAIKAKVPNVGEVLIHLEPLPLRVVDSAETTPNPSSRT